LFSRAEGRARSRSIWLLGLLSLLIVLIAACGGAQTQTQGNGSIVLKMSNSLNSTAPSTIALNAVADLIARQTNGRVVLEVYSSGQLGTLTSTLDQLRSGAIQMVMQNPSNVTVLLPEVGVFAAPYMFPSADAVLKAWNSQAGQKIVSDFKTQAHLHVFGPWQFGSWSILTVNKPVHSAGDMQGLKLRVPPSPVVTYFMSQLGASPIQMDIQQAFLGLQTGAVNGLPLPTSVIINNNLQAVIRYVTLTNFLYDVLNPILDDNVWQKISPSDQKIVTAAFAEGRAQNDQAILAATQASLDAVKKAGGTIIDSPDTASFQPAAQKTWANFESQWGGAQQIAALRAAASA
jgi:TRAP-type transport system periplasmic protein